MVLLITVEDEDTFITFFLLNIKLSDTRFVLNPISHRERGEVESTSSLIAIAQFSTNALQAGPENV